MKSTHAKPFKVSPVWYHLHLQHRTRSTSPAVAFSVDLISHSTNCLKTLASSMIQWLGLPPAILTTALVMDHMAIIVFFRSSKKACNPISLFQILLTETDIRYYKHTKLSTLFGGFSEIFVFLAFFFSYGKSTCFLRRAASCGYSDTTNGMDCFSLISFIALFIACLQD